MDYTGYSIKRGRGDHALSNACTDYGLGWPALRNPINGVRATDCGLRRFSHGCHGSAVGSWSPTSSSFQRSFRAPGEKEYPIPDEQLVCVTPGASGEAKLSTYTTASSSSRRHCTPTGFVARSRFQMPWASVTEWSTNQALLFFRSEMSCEDGKQQSFTGVSFFRRWNTWVDIQALANGTEREVVIRRYRARLFRSGEQAGIRGATTRDGDRRYGRARGDIEASHHGRSRRSERQDRLTLQSKRL